MSFALFFLGVSIGFYVYLPIHFFVINGCEDQMRVYIWACLGTLYLSPLYFVVQK